MLIDASASMLRLRGAEKGLELVRDFHIEEAQQPVAEAQQPVEILAWQQGFPLTVEVFHFCIINLY